MNDPVRYLGGIGQSRWDKEADDDARMETEETATKEATAAVAPHQEQQPQPKV